MLPDIRRRRSKNTFFFGYIVFCTLKLTKGYLSFKVGIILDHGCRCRKFSNRFHEKIGVKFQFRRKRK